MSVYIGRQLFLKARWAAIREDLWARLTGRPADLLPFNTLMAALRRYGQLRLPQPQSIPLDRIVGSTGRPGDFTRHFWPRGTVSMDRWVRLDVAMASLAGVPPIEVFQVGSVYFVSDGNHRVSVARASGFKEIEAYVTRILVDVDIQPGDSLAVALRKVQQARALAHAEPVEDHDVD
ncbi:MAG: hypothetical protein ACUVR4_06795 [Anaerolineae bacterium]